MRKRTYTKEELILAIKSSTSIRQVLIALGLAPRGGSYKTIHNAIKKFNIDTSHFVGQAWSKNKALNTRVSTEDYLANKKPISSFKLKIRLLQEKLLQPVCCYCNLAEWLGNPIPLELDHIDGDRNNNNLNNLRLLCPNCHALTPNYRGKNKGKGCY
jgi:hypothetical protein